MKKVLIGISAERVTDVVMEVDDDVSMNAIQDAVDRLAWEEINPDIYCEVLKSDEVQRKSKGLRCVNYMDYKEER